MSFKYQFKLQQIFNSLTRPHAMQLGLFVLLQVSYLEHYLSLANNGET